MTIEDIKKEITEILITKGEYIRDISEDSLNDETESDLVKIKFLTILLMYEVITCTYLNDEEQYVYEPIEGIDINRAIKSIEKLQSFDEIADKVFVEE